MSKRISSCRLSLLLLLGGLLLAVGCCLCSTRRPREEPLPPNVEVIADTAVASVLSVSQWFNDAAAQTYWTRQMG